MAKYIGADRYDNLINQTNSQYAFISRAYETLNSIESNKAEIERLQKEKSALESQRSILTTEVSQASNKQRSYQSELQALPGKIAQEEKELVIHTQKLKKLQKLDHLEHLMTDYTSTTDPVILVKEACIAHDKDAFEKALAKLSNVNAQDHQGKTSFMHAFQCKFTYGINKLLELKIDLHVKDQNEDNVFHHVVKIKNNATAEKLAETLIKYDDKIINDKDGQGKLPLYLYLEQGNSGITKLLLTDQCGGESLIYAAEHGNHAVATQLLYLQRNLVNYSGVDGKSVLSRSLELNRSEITKLLLSYGASVAEALDCNKMITSLDLNGVYLDASNLIIIADQLRKYGSLTALNFHGSNLGKDGVKIIALSLQLNKSVKQLDLSHNNAGYEGASSVIEALSVNNTLKALDIGHNNIGEPGGILMMTLLSMNSSLTVVKLASNNIGNTGAIFIANALSQNNSIIHIDLSNNNVGDEGEEALADALTVNCSLVIFNLSGNSFSHKGIGFFAKCLENNQSLLSLPGVEDHEHQIQGKIQQNMKQYEANLKKLETLAGLSLFNNDSCFKELFITFKQLQSEIMLGMHKHEINTGLYLSKLKEALHHFSSVSSSASHNSEDAAYESILSGQLGEWGDM